MKIAFVDTLGLPYDGNTINNRGLGGSESAVIYLSAELIKLGMDVTVFCHCNADDARPGVYNGVKYIPLPEIANHACDFDVAIASRSVETWLPPELRANVSSKVDLNIFDRLQERARFKVLWMHDTFCYGDQVVEHLVVHGCIHELFVLSDWHLSYVLNCDHGARRNFEVLKNKTFLTRNGAKNWLPWIDPSQKDPHQFVYNSSVSKGMAPLLEQIWPHVKQNIPEAKLKIIGGYYRFRPEDPPDEQEQKWRLLKDTFDGKQGVEFTGIITQQQIAQTLAQSSLMLYPSAFPETFGISALESLNALTPLVTCRFGALEEVAIDQACYKMDYAIAPNGLFPNINSEQQVKKYVELVCWAHSNKYLLQQKQNFCRIVQPLIGWDTVALQWKQHLCKVSGRYLLSHEFDKVSHAKLRWQQVFGRRYTNLEDHNTVSKPQQPIVVITPFYNCQSYIVRCIMSVATQSYGNYVHVLRDDASTDSSYQVAQSVIESLSPDIQHRFILQKNTSNQGAVQNQFEMLEYARGNHGSDAIVMLLDGDDCLVNRNDLFSFYNQLFDQNTEFTYGSCWSLADNIPLVAQEYPPHVKQDKSYRKHLFNWLMPYTHLRAFRMQLFNTIKPDQWQDENQKWFRAGGDTSVFYSLIEAADPSKVRAVQDIVMNYNDTNPLNDYKVNSEEQNQTARKVLGMTVQAPIVPLTSPAAQEKPSMNITPAPAPMPAPTLVRPKQILIGVPTARYIEVETFKSIYDQIVPANCEAHFQYFWGYNVEQVRNIMVKWCLQNKFDYMLNVDSDIVMPPHALSRLMEIQDEKTAVTSGVYIQRKEGVKIPEVFVHNPSTGGQMNMPIENVQGSDLIEVEGVGFGCCLVRTDVFQAVGNPWFEYRSSIDFSKVVSEDVDFCTKARAKGYRVVVDTGLKLGHLTKTTLVV